MEVPDPAGPPEGWDPGVMGPSAPLVPFRPGPADPDDLVGATVRGWTPNAGTYGMGGPGFVGLDLGDRWLVVTVWGAASWIRVDDRLLEDVPAGDPGVLVGWTITACVVERTWLTIDLSDPDGAHALRLASDPADRPVFAGDRRPRTEIWV
jgi:hypothetical protein